MRLARYLTLLTIATAYLTLLPAALLMHRFEFAYLGRMLGVAAYNTLGLFAVFALAATAPLRPLKGALFWFANAFLAIYALLLFYHVFVYDQMLGVPAISAVIDVNPAEAGEYLSAFTDTRAMAIAVLLTLPAVFAFSRRSAPIVLPGSLRALLAAAVLLWPAVGLSKQFLTHNSLFLVLGDGLYEVLSLKLEIARVVNDFAKIPKEGIVRLDPKPRVHVLIVGETTTRRHMSLYGYARPTTPRLESLRDRLYVAADPCSSHGSTIPALKEMLTFATRDNPQLLFEAPNLIEVMKTSGYKTFWLSNQQSFGFLSTWASIFANSADVARFVNAHGGDDDVSHLDTRSLDDKLFEPLAQALADPAPSKFILVHLMGSHADYRLRYPENFAKFGREPEASGSGNALAGLWKRRGADIDGFDNSVLYNDYIVHALLTKLDAAGADSVVYLADHGEGLGEGGPLLDHIDGARQKQIYEIPLIFHFGDRFEAGRQDLMARVAPALARPFQSDHLINTLLDIYDIEAPHAHREWSLFAPAYAPRVRFCDTL